MITRAYGNVNGQEIILTRVQGDKWETFVPFDEDGEYIIELWAEDEAGNTGYYCTMLLEIAGHELQTCVITESFTLEVEVKKYAGIPETQGFRITLRKSLFSAIVRKRGYTLDMEEGGYSIERAVCSGYKH